MSNEQLAAFVASVQESDELQEEVRELGADMDGIVALGRQEGFGFTAAELRDYVKSMRADLGRELSDEELEEIVGSGTITDYSSPASGC